MGCGNYSHGTGIKEMGRWRAESNRLDHNGST